ncbi:MAG: hypothetical protein C4325_07400 [Blastocatellia bacterium]
MSGQISILKISKRHLTFFWGVLCRILHTLFFKTQLKEDHILMRKTARGWEFPILQKTLVSLIFFSVTLLGLPLHGISQGDSSRFSGQQIFQ